MTVCFWNETDVVSPTVNTRKKAEIKSNKSCFLLPFLFQFLGFMGRKEVCACLAAERFTNRLN